MTIKGTYVLNGDGWVVRHKVENEDEQHFEYVMLHPNCIQYAKENKNDLFTIKDCPNLGNGGEWEPMAIVLSKEFFKGLNDHVMSALEKSTAAQKK